MHLINTDENLPSHMFYLSLTRFDLKISSLFLMLLHERRLITIIFRVALYSVVCLKFIFEPTLLITLTQKKPLVLHGGKRCVPHHPAFVLILSLGNSQGDITKLSANCPMLQGSYPLSRYCYCQPVRDLVPYSYYIH